MAKRLALIFLAAASPLVLASFFVPGRLGPLLFAFPAIAIPVALIAVGAARAGRLGPLTAPLLVLLLLLEGSAAAMLALRGQVADAPWLLGLPLPAAIQLYVMWLLPLGLVALAYALTFDSFTLTEGDLARLRRRARGEPEEG